MDAAMDAVSTTQADEAVLPWNPDASLPVFVPAEALAAAAEATDEDDGYETTARELSQLGEGLQRVLATLRARLAQDRRWLRVEKQQVLRERQDTEQKLRALKALERQEGHETPPWRLRSSAPERPCPPTGVAVQIATSSSPGQTDAEDKSSPMLQLPGRPPGLASASGRGDDDDSLVAGACRAGQDVAAGGPAGSERGDDDDGLVVSAGKPGEDVTAGVAERGERCGQGLSDDVSVTANSGEADAAARFLERMGIDVSDSDNQPPMNWAAVASSGRALGTAGADKAAGAVAVNAVEKKDRLQKEKPDKAESSKGPRSPELGVPIARSAQPPPTPLASAEAKKALSGIWEGSKGESYEFSFDRERTKLGEWTCTRRAGDNRHDYRDYPVRFDQDTAILRWGQNYFLDLKDVIAEPNTASWYRNYDGSKRNCIFAWRKKLITNPLSHKKMTILV